MKSGAAFAQGVGAGVGLLLVAGALTVACRPEIVAAWAIRGLRAGEDLSLKRRNRARSLAQRSPDYLDQCRAAGL